MHPDPYYDQGTLARLLKVSPRTLERWRVEGTGPAYVKAGRRVLYRREDMERWIDESLRGSSSDTGGARG